MKSDNIHISQRVTPRPKVLNWTERNFVMVKSVTHEVNKTRLNHYATSRIAIKYIKKNLLGRQQKQKKPKSIGGIGVRGGHTKKSLQEYLNNVNEKLNFNVYIRIQRDTHTYIQTHTDTQRYRYMDRQIGIDALQTVTTHPSLTLLKR